MTSFRRWLYYLKLAWFDLLRLRTTVVLHVIIVAGICLPILLLLGLKRGHIAQLRHDLVTSPSGRQIVVSAGGQGEIFSPASIPRLLRELGPVDVIVPDTERVADLSNATTPEDKKPSLAVPGVTFRSTVPGDPVLRQHDADLLKPNEKGVILFASVAKALAAKAGDKVRLTVSRRAGSAKEAASVTLDVRKIIPTDSDDKIGYLGVAVLDAIECYVRGGRVESFGWPALKEAARDRYAEYLLFCEVDQPLSEDDINAIDTRGYYVEQVIDEETRLLHGILKEESLGQLVVYRLFAETSRSDAKQRLALSPSEVAAITAADDVVVPWNEPRNMKIAQKPHFLVGFSLPARSWLKSHLLTPDIAFPYSADGYFVKFLGGTEHQSGAKLPLQFDSDHSIELEVPPLSSDSTPPTPSNPSIPPGQSPVVVVPVQLLARLDAYTAGLAQYDNVTGLFIPIPPAPTYTQVRLYARTIDDVLTVIPALEARHFAYRAQNARIKEIQGQDRQLVDLVLIVGLGVFFFGVFTVISVLLDATERKRGTIGIMRVMGVSRVGVFAIVFIRAIAVGLMAGLLTWAVGQGITYLLNFRPNPTDSLSRWLSRVWPEVTAIIGSDDIALVLAGAILCCVLGAIYPALKASRLDPFDAIVEGKFR